MIKEMEPFSYQTFCLFFKVILNITLQQKHFVQKWGLWLEYLFNAN